MVKGSPPKIKNGYFKLSRLLFDSTLWMCPPDELKLAVYLLGDARHDHTPKKFPGFKVERGETVTSLTLIAENCQWFENRKVRTWSKQKVSRMLKNLDKIGFLRHKSDTYGTHLTICNYDHYQNELNYKSDVHGTEADNSGTTMETYKNEKNVKKEEEKKLLGEYLIGKIKTENLTAHQVEIIEFIKYRNSLKKDKQCDTEKKINGIIRECLKCQKIYADLNECLEITAERGWMTPDPGYLEGKATAIGETITPEGDPF